MNESERKNCRRQEYFEFSPFLQGIWAKKLTSDSEANSYSSYVPSRVILAEASSASFVGAWRRRPRRSWRPSSSRRTARRSAKMSSERWTLCDHCNTRDYYNSTMPSTMARTRCVSSWSGECYCCCCCSMLMSRRSNCFSSLQQQHRWRRTIRTSHRRRLYPHREGVLDFCATNLRGSRIHSLAGDNPPRHEGECNNNRTMFVY